MVRGKQKFKQINQKNELIQSLEGTEYIKNPFVYSQIRGNFSLIQTNIMVAMISSIQERINNHIQTGQGIVGPLFSSEELNRGKIPFRIQLTELGLDTNQYPAVDEACEALTKLSVTYTYNENGEDRIVHSAIFTDIDIPKDANSGRRNGYIKLSMNASVVDQIFNRSNQYVEHMQNIAKLCRSPRTPRLYIYLSAWRKRQSEVVFDYNSVKEFLGCLEYNKDHTAIKVGGDKCPTYALFHRDVIDPAKREMRKLAEKGQIDFYFDYEPIYKNGRKRGNPDQIKFTIISSAALIQEAEEVKDTQPAAMMDADTMGLWHTFCTQLVDVMGQDWCETYVQPCKPLEFHDGTFVMGVPSTFVHEQLEAAAKKWSKTFKTVFGSKTRLCYRKV